MWAPPLWGFAVAAQGVEPQSLLIPLTRSYIPPTGVRNCGQGDSQVVNDWRCGSSIWWGFRIRMAPLAVAHVVPFFAPMVTGVGTHVWNICRGLPEIGFRILTPALRGEPRREPVFPNAEVIRIQPRAYWHEHYPPPYHPQFSPLVEEVLHLVRLVRIRAQVGRAEVVHNHMAPFERLYRLARRPGMKGISRLAGSALTFAARKVITTDHSLFSHLG